MLKGVKQTFKDYREKIITPSHIENAHLQTYI
jgi:hypothetical protein